MIESYQRISLRFIVLILVQTLVINNINLFGYINPMIYILFLLLFPFYKNQTLYIFLGFLIGLFIDLFSQGSGANTFASLTICFIRPAIIGFIFGFKSRVQSLSIINEPRIRNKILYVVCFVILHHLFYFIAVYFNTSNTFFVFRNTLTTSLFSIILLWVIMSFYKPNK